jgi:hypothetical protein
MTLPDGNYPHFIDGETEAVGKEIHSRAGSRADFSSPLCTKGTDNCLCGSLCEGLPNRKRMRKRRKRERERERERYLRACPPLFHRRS